MTDLLERLQNVDAAKLVDLLTRQEIHDVMMRYCRGIDRNDVDLIRSTYFPDAWDDHGPFKGTATEFFEFLGPAQGDLLTTMHNVCNETIEVDGDTAHCEFYCIAYHLVHKDGIDQDFLLGVRYIDRFERRDGEWRIAHRIVTREWEIVQPCTGSYWPKSVWVAGSRSHQDPVYRSGDR